MPTRRNPYSRFNSPLIAQAASELAGLFGPMSPADIAAQAQAGYATARTDGERASQGRLSELWNYAASPDFDPAIMDRRAPIEKLYAPTQGFGARDMADETARRGDDLRLRGTLGAASIGANASMTNARLAAETARQNALLNQQGGLVSDLYGALDPGQVRPEVPSDVAQLFGMPALGAVAGAPVPLNETQAVAAALQSLPIEVQQARALGGEGMASVIQNGQPVSMPRALSAGGRPVLSETDERGVTLAGMERDVLEALAQTGQGVETVQTPDGPRIESRAGAVGMEPFVNPGSQPRPENATAILPDGRRVPVLQGGDGAWVEAQTGVRVPPDAEIVKMPQLQGGEEDIGGSRAIINRAERMLASTTRGIEIVDDLTASLAANPGAAGVAGAVQRFTQNAIQTIDEVSQAFGGRTPNMSELVAGGFIDPGVAATRFNPALPEIEQLKSQLIWAYAAANQGDGRVSNQQMDEAEAALQLRGVVANSAAIRAAAARMRVQFERDRRSALAQLPASVRNAYSAETRGTAGAPGAIGGGAQPAVTRRRAQDANGNTVEWDGSAWVPVN